MKTGMMAAVVLLAAVACAEDHGIPASFSHDAMPYLADAPELVHFLTNSLDVAEVGQGMRLASGITRTPDRVCPPFAFDAKPKGTTGAFTVRIIIPMRTADASGHLSANRVIVEGKTKCTEQTSAGDVAKRAAPAK